MTAKTQAALTALMRSLFPEDFIGPMLDGAAPNGEAFHGAAAVFARLSVAAKRLNDGLSPNSATFGEQAVGSVVLSRTGTAAGTLYAGSVLVTRYGEPVVLTADCAWGSSDVADKTVAARSWRRSWQANVPAGTLLAVRLPIGAAGDPLPLFDQSITAAVVSMTGATPPDLEALAAVRGIAPQAGEDAPHFRARLRTLADDKVTPGAVARQAVAAVPGAVVYEGAATCWAVGVDCVEGSYDIAVPFAGKRLYSGLPINRFTVGVPVLPGGSECPFAVNVDAVNVGGALSGVNPARMPDGTLYDMGSPGRRSDLAMLTTRVEATRAHGILWNIEEITT